MKKQVVVIGIAFLLMAIVLSGCNETNKETAKAEIVDYSVVTSWTTGKADNLTNYSMPGFYHQIPSDANEYSPVYIVNATIKNTGERFLKNVSIEVSFNAENNKAKAWQTLYMDNLDILETRNFSCTLGNYSIGQGGATVGPMPYFYDISNVSFSITVIE